MYKILGRDNTTKVIQKSLNKIPQEGLICNLDMQHRIGANIQDRTKHGYDGVTGNVTSVKGIKDINSGIYFTTSTSSYCNISNLFIADYNTFSINVWIKGTQTSMYPFMSGFYNFSNNTRYVRISTGANAISFGFRYNSTWPWRIDFSTNKIQDGNWHMITAVRNGETNSIYLYFDGVRVGDAEGTATQNPSIIGSYPMTLNGVLPVSRTGLFTHGGFLFYDRVLREKEIEYLYNKGYGIK